MEATGFIMARSGVEDTKDALDRVDVVELIIT